MFMHPHMSEKNLHHPKDLISSLELRTEEISLNPNASSVDETSLLFGFALRQKEQDLSPTSLRKVDETERCHAGCSCCKRCCMSGQTLRRKCEQESILQRA
jgi:hypothetical protein